MRAYELMVILDGDLEEPVAQAWIKTIANAITVGWRHGPRQARLVGEASLHRTR